MAFWLARPGQFAEQTAAPRLAFRLRAVVPSLLSKLVGSKSPAPARKRLPKKRCHNAGPMTSYSDDSTNDFAL
jgi:hypothetical protein